MRFGKSHTQICQAFNNTELQAYTFQQFIKDRTHHNYCALVGAECLTQANGTVPTEMRNSRNCMKQQEDTSQSGKSTEVTLRSNKFDIFTLTTWL
jgi:hypothetical protein